MRLECVRSKQDVDVLFAVFCDSIFNFQKAFAVRCCSDLPDVLITSLNRSWTSSSSQERCKNPRRNRSCAWLVPHRYVHETYLDDLNAPHRSHSLMMSNPKRTPRISWVVWEADEPVRLIFFHIMLQLYL